MKCMTSEGVTVFLPEKEKTNKLEVIASFALCFKLVILGVAWQNGEGVVWAWFRVSLKLILGSWQLCQRVRGCAKDIGDPGDTRRNCGWATEKNYCWHVYVQCMMSLMRFSLRPSSLFGQGKP